MRPSAASRRLWRPPVALPAGLVLIGLLLSACGAPRPLITDGPPSGSVAIPDLPDDPIPRPEPRSRYGNNPEYEVLGQRYRVMESSRGYRERGVASWYGTKFHGRLTSNRETYDMYAMTAAHKTLPLPTFVEVRNLRNNKTIIVRVNDRGPFAHNRIIDLSYAAALKLDMIETGTALVEVRAIDFEPADGDRPTRASSEPAQDYAAPDNAGPVYVQVGAFGSQDNAERLYERLKRANIGNVLVVSDPRETLFRVRIGPVKSVHQFDILTEELENLGIETRYLVTPDS